MSHTQTIELIGAACLVVTGLSHVLYPGAWQALFARWAEKGPTGALLNGLLHAAVGTFFVALHPVFSGWSSVLTYWACAVAAKGALYLLVPELGLRSMRNLTPERAHRLRWTGIPMCALGVLIAVICSRLGVER